MVMGVPNQGFKKKIPLEKQRNNVLEFSHLRA
jgi:hypothetical protein